VSHTVSTPVSAQEGNPWGTLAAIDLHGCAFGPLAGIEVDHAQEVNAVRLAERLGLTLDHTLGATHALNGDKILPINPFSGAPRAPERAHRRSVAAGAFRLSRTAGAERELIGLARGHRSGGDRGWTKMLRVP
jgi:hypothetical protein